MRQVCPNCLKSIDLPDAAAGTDAACPNCGKTFPVPAAYAPSVAVPPPPPVPTTPVDRPPPPPGLVPGAVPPAPPPAADGLAEAGFALSPKALVWVPAGALTVAFLLTFFPWAGLYPGGVATFTQLPWQALVGGMSDNAGLPAELLTGGPSVTEKLSAELRNDEARLAAHLGANLLLLLPYLMLLVLTLALAWAERFVHAPALPAGGRLAPLAGLWPRRLDLLTSLTTVLAVLLFFQCVRGFGVQSAARQVAAERAAALIESDARLKGLPDESTRKRATADVLTGQQLGLLAPGGTVWRDLALIAHLVAAFAAVGRLWLARRGDRPLPRLVLRT
jgi:hypothetical protein